MNRYHYWVRDRAGRRMRGELIAVDSHGAVDLLQEAGFHVTSVLPVPARKGWFFPKLALLPGQERLLVLEAWATLLDSGITLQASFLPLQRMVPLPSVARALRDVQHGIDHGLNFSQALRVSRLFPPSWIALIAAGESRGDFVGPLRALHRHVTESLRIRKELLLMAITPAILLGLVVLWFWIFVGWVMPNLMALVERSGGSMPMLERIASFSSALWQGGLWMTLVLCVLLLAGWRTNRRNPTLGLLQVWIHPSFPVLGSVISKMNLILIASEIRLQMEAGITLLEAVRGLSQSIPNRVVRRDLIEAYRRLRQGDPVPEALGCLSVLSPMGRAFLWAGDTSGKLPELLEVLVKETSADLKEQVKRLTLLLRNAMIFAMGLIVGLIVVSSYTFLYTRFDGFSENWMLSRSIQESWETGSPPSLLRASSDAISRFLNLQ